LSRVISLRLQVLLIIASLAGGTVWGFVFARPLFDQIVSHQTLRSPLFTAILFNNAMIMVLIAIPLGGIVLMGKAGGVSYGIVLAFLVHGWWHPANPLMFGLVAVCEIGSNVLAGFASFSLFRGKVGVRRGARLLTCSFLLLVVGAAAETMLIQGRLWP